MTQKKRLCTACNSRNTIKKGKAREVQTYLCIDCGKRFSGTRRKKITLIKHIWKDSVFGKQTIRELSSSYDMDRRSIRILLDEYKNTVKIHSPRPVHIIVDGTYFGEQKEDTDWCTIVARDPIRQEDLSWLFTETETTYAYVLIREELERLGYTILSVTGDGFSGIKTAFSGIPIQMCHVHMERGVIKGTTRKPLTEAGQVLLALVRTLHEDTDEEIFNRRLNIFITKYRGFLNERTTHSLTGDWSWTHEGVRQALNRIILQKPYLFTYKQNKNIPQTTNSLEGHFSHIKNIVGIHRGLSEDRKQKMLNTILLASSIAPSKNKLDEIL